jgi:hypothetical protein
MPRPRQPWERTSSPWQLHALGRDVMRDLERDYRTHGVSAIESLRKDRPWSYLWLLLSLVPRQALSAQDSLSEVSDEEFHALLQAAREALAAKDQAELTGNPVT